MSDCTLRVHIEAPGLADGQTVYLAALPGRAETFFYPEHAIPYRVVDIRHEPHTIGGVWSHHITMILEYK